MKGNSLGNRLRRKDILPPFRMFYSLGADRKAGSRFNLKEVARMATIDADAHVVESEHTWNDMDPTERKYRPILVSPHGASEERPVQSILDTGGWRTSGSRGATGSAGCVCCRC